MAHQLHMTNGRAAMMFVRTTPWHGLGTMLKDPPTAAEAIEAAQLDWRVKKVPVYAAEKEEAMVIPRRYAVVPEDRWGTPDCPVFGMVGEDYTPLQNEDAFAFFDSVVGAKAATYETAGALGDGSRVWVLAKMRDTMRVVGDDIAENYLLLANGHDGNTAVQMKFTPVRVVCQNTLSLAINAGDRPVKVHHGWNFQGRMDQASIALGLIHERFTHLETQFKAMAKMSLSQAQLDAYLGAVFLDPRGGGNGRAVQVARRCRLKAVELFETGPGNTEQRVKGTLWAAFNAVTDYLDHFHGNYTPARRLESVWFGNGYAIKSRAYRIATEMASAAGHN